MREAAAQCRTAALWLQKEFSKRDEEFVRFILVKLD